jgi:divalent metal cation (Fe/Co/Zn/Cd) transporter
LLFFDALGALLCVAVDVGSNFSFWSRSSIRAPFGFERSEVLAGLGMSVGLCFMGFDLLSHGLTHLLENKGGHAAHHEHAHDQPTIQGVASSALLAIGATLVSALVLKNHARIGKVMRIGSSIPWLPTILTNPSHLMTLSCSLSLVLLGFILTLSHSHLYKTIDRILSFSLSIAMLVLGWHLGWKLGKMLMMSYSGPDPSEVLYELGSDPSIVGVEEARFWQVHYGLCQANLKIRVRNLDTVERLREKISSLVRNRLGGGYGVGSGGQRWEVSTQITLAKD